MSERMPERAPERAPERREITIDLRKLLLVYLRNWWIILSCGAVGASLALLITMTAITPLYRATVTVYVNNVKSTQNIESISSATLSAAQQLVNTYTNIIQSDRVLSKAVEKLNQEDLTVESLRKMLTATQVQSTEIFSINITHPDPEIAAEIANVVANVSPNEIAEVVEGSSARIIDYASVPSKRFSPSYRNNTVLGGALGILAAAMLITLRFLLDVRIKDEEDLAQLFSIPVLGQIPSFSRAGNLKSAYESESAPGSPSPSLASHAQTARPAAPSGGAVL